MTMELVVHFDYGAVVPWVRRLDDGMLSIVAGPTALPADAIEHRGRGLTTVTEFAVGPGERVPFLLGWHPSHLARRTPSMPMRPSNEPRRAGASGRSLHLRCDWYDPSSDRCSC